MWISVESGKIPYDHLVIDPGNSTKGSESSVLMTLRYGVAERSINVTGLKRMRNSDRERPIKVLMAPELIVDLCVKTEPIYRLKVNKKSRVIEIGPVMGMLLGYRSHWYGQGWLNREAERVTKVYPHTGGLIVAFSPRSLSLVERCAYGLYWDPLKQDWKFGQLPLPSVLHRRSFQTADHTIQAMCKETGIRCFNSRRYNKLEFYQLLSQDPLFQAHLPETIEVHQSTHVMGLVECYGSVILKPAALSRGRGILFLAQGRGRLQLMDCRVEGTPKWRDLTTASLKRLVDQELAPAFYLCQQRIDLALIDGRPFDIRIVMQRNEIGQWGCSGIECRLAGSGRLVTNIATGGYALSLPDSVHRSFDGSLDADQVNQRIEMICYRLCQALDHTGESFGELGIDIALDRNGHEWIIEANVLPTFKGFMTLDHPCYQRLLAAPLLYANWLSGFGGEQNRPVSTQSDSKGFTGNRPT